jgi:superfamily I DNA/RNA helicase
MESLTAWLKAEGISACFLLTDQLPGAVRLSTIHSAKGLDAASVLLFARNPINHVMAFSDDQGTQELETRGDEEARRLLYIGMTRAREELCVSYHAESGLMEELERILSSPVYPPGHVDPSNTG